MTSGTRVRSSREEEALARSVQTVTEKEAASVFTQYFTEYFRYQRFRGLICLLAYKNGLQPLRGGYSHQSEGSFTLTLLLRFFKLNVEQRNED